METMMRQDLVKIKSSRLFNELNTFYWYGNKGQAQPGYHDDLVMAFMIALWTRDSAIMLENYSLDSTRQSLGLIKTTQNKSKMVKHDPNAGHFNSFRENIDWLYG